ncbi:MAG: tetratricopeptide repeat protein [Ferruginibacter sp.]
MNRYFGYCICMLFAVASSCNDNEVNSSAANPDAEKEIRELVSQYPDSLLLKENLIQYLRDNGAYSAALTETNNVLKKDTLNARFYNIKGTLSFENGDTANSIIAIKKAVSINPLPEYVLSLGSLYAQTKNAMALSIADELLKLPGADARQKAYFIKGLYFSYAGNKIKAISFFNTCLELNYRDVLSYREKAVCLYDLGKYSTAIDELQKAVSVQNTFDEGYYWMGRCYEKLDKKNEAANNYRQALQIDPDYKEAKDALQKLAPPKS